jgi:hypothetical protein
MALEFPVSEGWGDTSDLDFRNEIWDYLDRFVFWTGNGSITGGDTGSGTVNLYFETLIPEMAVDTVVNALQGKKTERAYKIILLSNESPGKTDTDSNN